MYRTQYFTNLFPKGLIRKNITVYSTLFIGDLNLNIFSKRRILSDSVEYLLFSTKL